MEAHVEQEFAITLDWRGGYEFTVDFELDGVPPLLTDESPPLGEGVGPSPARLLAAAVGNCMSASLKFCLDKARVEVREMKTRVVGTMERNERGRLRIGSLRVVLEPEVASEELSRIGRCLDVFEDFCIVGQSVSEGIPLKVSVTPTTDGVVA